MNLAIKPLQKHLVLLQRNSQISLLNVDRWKVYGTWQILGIVLGNEAEKKGSRVAWLKVNYKCKYRMNYRGHSTDVMDRAAVNLANLWMFYQMNESV